MKSQQSSVHSLDAIWQMLKTLPITAAEVIRGKQAAIRSSKQLRHPLRPLTWPASSASWIQNELEQTLASVRASGVQPASMRSSQLDP